MCLFFSKLLTVLADIAFELASPNSKEQKDLILFSFNDFSSVIQDYNSMFSEVSGKSL